MTPSFIEAQDFGIKLARSYHLQYADREDLIQELSIVALQVSRRYKGKAREELGKILRTCLRRRAKVIYWQGKKKSVVWETMPEGMDIPGEKNSFWLEELKAELSKIKVSPKIIRKLFQGFTVKEISKSEGLNYRKVYRERERLREEYFDNKGLDKDLVVC